MDIDLEEEQDPPSFTEARWRDKLSKVVTVLHLLDCDTSKQSLLKQNINHHDTVVI